MTEGGLYVDEPFVRHTSLTSFIPPIGSQIQVAAASAKRKRITFVSAGPNIMQLNTDNPANAGRFIQLSAQGPILTLDFDDVGSMIQGTWYAQSLVAPMGLAVIDTVEH